MATGITAGERMARRRSLSGCEVTCELAFSRLSPSVGPTHWNNWDGVDGPSMSDPDWNTSHLQTKMFYSSMEMPTSIVGFRVSGLVMPGPGAVQEVWEM